MPRLRCFQSPLSSDLKRPNYRFLLHFRCVRAREFRETERKCGLPALRRPSQDEASSRESKAMPPTDLDVPFHEKDDAKRLGARWDAVRKTWFLADRTATAPFTKWLPRQPDINIRCHSYFVAQSMRTCWHCDRDTGVFSFVLPPGHEAWGDCDHSVKWELQVSAAIVYYITWIPLDVQARIRAVTGQYRNDFSKTIQSFYWMNHCERCGVKQGDFELFEEFDTPFRPINRQDACRILLHPVRKAFEAAASSMTYEPGFFERMKVLF
jgi:hypothetical protein